MSAVAVPRPTVDDVLEDMSVTDRLFHDLYWTVPLVEAIRETLRRVKPSGKLLAIAPNALLLQALLDDGYDVDVWQHELSLLQASHRDVVRRRGSFDALFGDMSGGPYDVISVTYALDRSAEHPVSVLGRLRQLMSPGGVVLLTHKLSGGLHARREGVVGRAVPADEVSRPEPLNYAWFPVPARRIFSGDDVNAWALRGGFALEEHRPVIDRRAVNRIVPMTVAPWLRARVSHAVQELVPGLRDSAIAVLRPRPGPFAAFSEGLDFPLVSVLVTPVGDPQLDACLASLADVAYPPHRFEVLVAGANGFLPRENIPVRIVDVGQATGLEMLRRLVGQARGDVVAITDGLSRVSRGWIDVGLNRLGRWTPGVRGQVWPEAGSAGPFLTLPGQRPEVGPGGWLSAANIVMRRAVLERALEPRDDGPAAAWGAELGCRLEQLGMGLDYQDWARVTRLFPFPMGRAWLGEEYRNAQLVAAMVRRRSQLRSGLVLGIFASRRTAVFDLLLVATIAAIAARSPWPFVAGLLVWLASCHRHLYLWPRQWGTTFRHLRGMLLRSFVWFAGLTVGSIKSRTVVL